MKYLKYIIVAIFVLILTQISTTAYPIIPISSLSSPVFCTRLDLDFDGIRYKDKVLHCKRHVTTTTKRKVYNSYGIPKTEWHLYTIDHLVPLFLGGSNDIRNLWPQSKKTYTGNIEGKMYFKVNTGEISAYEALNIILKVKYENTKVE